MRVMEWVMKEHWKAEGKRALTPSLNTMTQNSIFNSHWLPIVNSAKSGCFQKTCTLHTDDFLYSFVQPEFSRTCNIRPAACSNNKVHTFYLPLVLCITMGYTLSAWYKSLRPHILHSWADVKHLQSMLCLYSLMGFRQVETHCLVSITSELL